MADSAVLNIALKTVAAGITTINIEKFFRVGNEDFEKDCGILDSNMQMLWYNGCKQTSGCEADVIKIIRTKDMYNMISKLKKLLYGNMRNLFAFSLIFLCTYITGCQSIKSPGVYFDSVCPDFIAAVGAFPGVDNFAQITQHVGLPLLGNFYHGTLTAGIQFIVLKCTIGGGAAFIPCG